MRRSLFFASVCALALAAAACGGSDTTPTAPTAPVPTAGTETFVGLMAPGGTAVRTFTASAAGTASITLSTTDPGGIVLGFGIGIPGSNVGACDMTKTLQAQAGAQITAPVEAGLYCAGTFDIGTVGKTGVVVGLTVTHP